MRQKPAATACGLCAVIGRVSVAPKPVAGADSSPVASDPAGLRGTGATWGEGKGTNAPVQRLLSLHTKDLCVRGKGSCKPGTRKT